MHAGFAKLDVTPDVKTEEVCGLGYWFQRCIRFTGVRDPLFVRCAAVGEGKDLCFIVSVDAVLDSFGFSRPAAARIAGRFGIATDRVFISCTHTHSAPMIGLNETRTGEEYGRRVEDAIVAAAEQAAGMRRELSAARCRGTVTGVLYNRRPILKTGKVAVLHESADPAQIADPGLIDDTMTVIRFSDAKGVPIGALCHFGIHGVCIQCSDLISSDGMGRAIQRAEAALSGPCVILHLNGPCGDIDPAAMGDEAALEKTADRLFWGILPLMTGPGNAVALGPAAGVAGTFPARRRETRTLAAIARRRADREPAARADVAVHHHSGPGYELFILNEESHLAQLPETVEIGYQILRLGDIVLVGIEGEIFTCFGTALSRGVPGTLVVGHVGGWKGYFPPAAAFGQGGYEVTPSRWSRVSPGETERLWHKIREAMNGLFVVGQGPSCMFL